MVYDIMVARRPQAARTHIGKNIMALKKSLAEK
jgi:hypothetical protein